MIIQLTPREVALALLAGLRSQGKIGDGDFGVKFSWSPEHGVTAEVGPPFVGPVPALGRVVPESDTKAWRRKGA